MRTTRIYFEAVITLRDDEIDAWGGIEQSVQNEIGHSGAMVVRVLKITEGPVSLDQEDPDGSSD